MRDQSRRINGALYPMCYEEMQLELTRELLESDTVFAILNAGSAEIEGAELEVSMLFLQASNGHRSTSY